MLLVHTRIQDTQVHWLSQPNPASDWIRRETNASTWFIQLYLQVSYDFFVGIDVYDQDVLSDFRFLRYNKQSTHFLQSSCIFFSSRFDSRFASYNKQKKSS